MDNKVLLIQPIHHDAIAKLMEEAEVVIAESTEESAVKKAIKDVKGVIVRVTPLTRAIIESGEKLRVIGRHGVGLDNIDLKAATEYRIPVVYAPGSNTNAVAEHTVTLMLALAKKLFKAHMALTQRGDYQCRLSIKTSEIKDKVIGIVGFGQIGRRVAAICQYGFGAKLIAYDPYLSPEILQSSRLEVKVVDKLDDLLREADYVSLHAPATPDNFKLIGARELSLMKQSAFLINTARGELIDEEALYQALTQGIISGAGLDVFDPEPPEQKNPLFSLSNVVVTPHMAAHSEEGLRMMAMMVAEQVLQVLRGERPPCLANPQIWENRRFGQS
ncbi:MAG: hydroxyacid dehydrogenase [Peptococcaceae bacterium]|jgi:D-3-phosphoglycerate dehydrogenase|nr:hydroxyacid dehydrogenase [Peptococcaceae bacterium]MDH7525494.1 hydroxyacid dehydrogenase [Peptococcaceae bacterium]